MTMPRLTMSHLLGPLVACVALAVSACAGASPADPTLLDVPVDSSVTLKVGQVVRVGDGSLRIRFEGVVSDSRCPIDVVCVWEGDAAVRLRFIPGEGEETQVDLHTALEPRSHSVSGYRVTLEGLDPVPRSGSPTPQSQYAATIGVSMAP